MRSIRASLTGNCLDLYSVSLEGGARHGQWRANENVAQKHYFGDVIMAVLIANAGFEAGRGRYNIARAGCVVSEGVKV